MKTIKPPRSYPADPLAEIRQIREEIAAEHGYNLHAIVAALSKEPGQAGRRVVDRSKPPTGVRRKAAAAAHQS